MRLRPKLISSVLGLVITGMIAISWLSYDRTEQAIHTSILNCGQEATQTVAARLNLLLLLTRQHLRIMAHNPLFVTYLESEFPRSPQQSPQFQSVNNQLEFAATTANTFNLVALYTTSGRLVACSDKNLVGVNAADRPYVQRALAGEEVGEGAQELVHGEHTYILAIPVLKDQKVIGVLAAALDMSFLENMLVGKTRESDYLAIVDTRGELVLAPPGTEQLSRVPWLDRVLLSSSGMFTVDELGKKLTVYFAALPEQDWVVVNVNRNDALFAAVQTIRNGNLLITVTTCLLIALFLFILLSRLTQNISRGVTFAREVADGNLDKTLEIHRSDELGTLAEALNAMVCQLREALSNSEKQTRELSVITNGIDGGVARFLLDRDYTILWGNTGLYALAGYAYGEECGGALTVVHPDDRLRIQRQLHAVSRNLLSKSSEPPLSLTFRILHKKGHVLWLYGNVSFIGLQEGIPVGQGVFMDITRQQKAMQALELEQNRNRILLELSDDLIFEYEPKSDIITFSGTYQDFYGEKRTIPAFRSQLDIRGILNPDDMGLLLNAFDRALKTPGRRSSTELRLRKRDSRQYIWFALHCASMLDPEGELRLLGKLSNIHARKLKEEDLLLRSSTDGLTGLYNKTAAEKMIHNALEEDDLREHALIIVDLDDFKQANDTRGHLFGDTVLKNAAQAMRATFRSSDICGRIGGDEFLILMRGIASPAHVEKRLRAFQETFAHLNSATGYTISSSLGVALFPQAGRDYLTLFQAADRALYRAKQNGKKQLCWARSAGSSTASKGTPDKGAKTEDTQKP